VAPGFRPGAWTFLYLHLEERKTRKGHIPSATDATRRAGPESRRHYGMPTQRPIDSRHNHKTRLPAQTYALRIALTSIMRGQGAQRTSCTPLASAASNPGRTSGKAAEKQARQMLLQPHLEE
jgi:hypothetical protein